MHIETVLDKVTRHHLAGCNDAVLRGQILLAKELRWSVFACTRHLFGALQQHTVAV
jgi:hypothetical protein